MVSGGLSGQSLIELPGPRQALARALNEWRVAAGSPHSPPLVVKAAMLSEGAVAWMTEIHLELLTRRFNESLTRSLRELEEVVVAKSQAAGGTWVAEIDAAPLVYDEFSPPLWDLYRAAWSQWSASVTRIHEHVGSIVVAELGIEREEQV
jgi:hypothetical protein